MRQISEFPRVELGVLPTPLYKLENLSRETGKNIYIKRDDMIGVALGGNKVRKLEFLLADAKEKGVDVVFTAGGAQSNHAMLTAACASRLGMRAVLVLKKRGELAGGNQILNKIFGALFPVANKIKKIFSGQRSALWTPIPMRMFMHRCTV